MNTDSWRRLTWKEALGSSYLALALVPLVRAFQYACFGYGGEDAFALAYLGQQSATDFAVLALFVPAHVVDVVVFGLPAFITGSIVQAMGSQNCGVIAYVVLGQALLVSVGRWPGSLVDAFKLSVLAVASVLHSRKESRMPPDDEYSGKVSDRFGKADKTGAPGSATSQGEAEVVSESGVRAEMESIRLEYPSLPMVPIEPIRYRGWITETVDQIQAGVLTKTLDRKLAVLERVNRVHEQLFKLAHTQYETGRFKGREALEDLQLEADMEDQRLRIAKARGEIRKLQAQANPEKPRLTPAEEIREMLSGMIASLAELKRLRGEVEFQFSEELKDQDFRDWVERVLETKRLDIMGVGHRREKE